MQSHQDLDASLNDLSNKKKKPQFIADDPIFTTNTIQKCMDEALLNRNAASVEGDRARTPNLWIDGIHQPVPLNMPLERMDEKIHPIFQECHHQCSFPYAGTLYLMGNIVSDGLVIEGTHPSRKNEYFIFSKTQIVSIESSYLFNYLNSFFQPPAKSDGSLNFDDPTVYAFRGSYTVKIMPEKLPFSIEDNTFYLKVDPINKQVNYAVKSPAGEEIRSFIKLKDLRYTATVIESELYKRLPIIFKITAERGHTRPLIPIAKSVTISLIHPDEKGCELFLMSNPPKVEDYQISDNNHLYLYKEKDGDDERVFYYTKENNRKQYLDKDILQFPQDEPFNSLKCDNKELTQAVLDITSKRSHTQKPHVTVLKHVRFVLDEKNNDILFSKEQDHVFKRFDSSLEEVEIEADLLIKSNLFVTDKRLSLTDKNYRTPAWLKQIQDDLCKTVDETQNINHLKRLVFKLREGYPDSDEDGTLQLINDFISHISQLHSSGANEESLMKDLRCVAKVLIDDSPQHLVNLYERAQNNLSAKNKQVWGTIAASTVASACVVAGLSFFAAPAAPLVVAGIAAAGASVAGAGIAGTKKVKANAEEKRVKPASYEEEILNALLKEYLDNQDYAKFVLYEIELIKAGIASRGVENLDRNVSISTLEFQIKENSTDILEIRELLVKCRDNLRANSPTSKTANDIHQVITKLTESYYQSLMRNEFDLDHFHSYMLLRLNNIMDNAKLRKTDAQRDKILQDLFTLVKTLDSYPNAINNISDCINKLKKQISRNSTSAVELEQLQSELSAYAELYKPQQASTPTPSITTTTTTTTSTSMMRPFG